MKIKDYMKLGAGVYAAHCTYVVVSTTVAMLLKPVSNKLEKMKKELEDSKPENEEES